MQNEILKAEETKSCPFTKAACGKGCALYVYDRGAEKGECVFVDIAKIQKSIASAAHGIWGELKDRY